MLLVKISWVVVLCLSVVFHLSNNDNGAIEPPNFSYSYSCTVVKRAKPSFKRRLLQGTAFLVFPLVCWVLQRLEPLIHSAHSNLLPPIALWQDPLVKEYEELFKHVDCSVLPVPKPGPKKNTLAVDAKVFLIKVNETLQYSSDVRAFFLKHPQLIALVGFHPVYHETTGALELERTVVSARHFRRKLHTMKNQHVKLLLKQTVDQLQAQDLLKGTVIADTTEILARVKENNLKQRVDNRFDKTRTIKGFPECSLGAKPIPGEKDKQGKPKMRYFWGAKQAALVEPTEHGPAFLYEEVFTAKTSDVKTALPTLKPLVEQWKFRLKKFLADAAYDAFEIYQ